MCICLGYYLLLAQGKGQVVFGQVMPADRDQLAAAQNVGGARISKECTNRQAVYLASSHTHTHTHR